MALTKIGAIIELEGANNFTSQMKSILGYAKDLKREMDVLTSSFDKNAKTTQNLKDQKNLLAQTIQNTRDKLKTQETALKQVNDATSNNALMTKEQAKQYEGLQRDVANTTIELNNLLQKQKELNQDNSLTLFVDAFKNTTSKTGEALKSIGSGMTKAFTLPIVGAGTIAVKEFTSLESGFAGVRKTVDGTKEELESLRIALNKIPLETASSAEAVYSVAEAAGQLGVELDQIPDFTKNIIMLADSTNIMAEEGAVNIAQFLNIMKESPETVGDFGNSLVALGNNFATDEASILRLSTRLASAGKLIGLSTGDVLGLATAMSAMGLTAEAGGTAMSTTMKQIQMDVANGTDNLKLFGEITGQTAEEFANSWRANPIKALQDFLIGMTNLEGGSEGVITMLDELGFSGIRQSDAIQRLTLGYNELEKAVELANAEYENGTALTDEASKRYETFATSINQLKEAFKLFMAEIGVDIVDVIKPMIEGLTNTIKNLTEWWKGLSDPMQKFILGLLGVVAAIGPILAIGGSLLIFFAKLKTSLGVLGLAKAGAEFSGLGSLIGKALIPKLGTLAKSLGILVAGHPVIAGVIAGAVALYTAYKTNFLGMKDTIDGFVSKVKEKFTEMKDTSTKLWDALKNALSNTTSQLSNDVKAKMEQMKNETRNKTNQMKNEVSNNFNNMKNDATNHAVQMGNNVANTIRNATPNVQSASYQLVNTGVDKPLSSVSGSAYTWGSHIGSQFAAGISSMISRVASAASSLASRVRAYIGFSEPEKGPLSDFHTYMPDMIELMVKGINDNAYKVDNAINNLASNMAGGINNNYGGITINMNVPQGTNGYQLVDQIETEITNRAIRRRMVFN